MFFGFFAAKFRTFLKFLSFSPSHCPLHTMAITGQNFGTTPPTVKLIPTADRKQLFANQHRIDSPSDALLGSYVILRIARDFALEFPKNELEVEATTNSKSQFPRAMVAATVRRTGSRREWSPKTTKNNQNRTF